MSGSEGKNDKSRSSDPRELKSLSLLLRLPLFLFSTLSIFQPASTSSLPRPRLARLFVPFVINSSTNFSSFSYSTFAIAASLQLQRFPVLFSLGKRIRFARSSTFVFPERKWFFVHTPHHPFSRRI